MRVVREEAQFVVVDKPTGWLSVPSRLGRAETRPVVGLELERVLGTRIWPVHRLDEDVSGLLLFAKNAEAHRWASALFEGRGVQKRYEALTLEEERGRGREAAGISLPLEAPGAETRAWESKLLRGKRRAFERPDGKPSRTRARDRGLVEVEDRTARLWDLEPLTGRAHQLRFEMMKRFAPIWGDELYGSQVVWPRGGVALRSVALRFAPEDHPEAYGLPLELSVEGLGAVLRS